MTISLTTGAKYAIAKTYGPAIAFTAITNAAEAVITLPAGHPVVTGEFVEVTSPGWRKLHRRIARVKAVDANDATLERIKTTNVDLYPAGEGVGSIRRITAWDTMSQVKDVKSSGGEQQFADVTDTDDDTERKAPTIRGANTVDFDVYDDPDMPWYETVEAAEELQKPTAFRARLRSGAVAVANAYWSKSKVPSLDKNSGVTAKVSLSYVADPTSYPA